MNTTNAKQVTFDETVGPPRERRPITQAAVPTPQTTTQPSITTAIIHKPITKLPTPRVQATNLEVNEIPPPRAQAKPAKEPSLQQTKLHSHIRETTTNRARLPQSYNKQLWHKNKGSASNSFTTKTWENSLTTINSSVTQNTQKYGQNQQ